MGEGPDDGASSDPSELDSVAMGAAETVEEAPNDDGKRARDDHEVEAPAKLAKVCQESTADNADGASPPVEEGPNDIGKRCRDADEVEGTAKRPKVSQESPADIAEDASHPEASKSPSQVSQGGAVAETLEDKPLAVPMHSEKKATQEGGSDSGGGDSADLDSISAVMKQLASGVVTKEHARSLIQAQVVAVNGNKGDGSLSSPAARVCENGGHNSVLINAEELGRLATRKEQAEDGLSGHGSAGGIVQQNASAHSLPNVPPQSDGGVVVGSAESGTVQKKRSAVLFELLDTGKAANVSRNVLYGRLKDLKSELAECVAKKDFLRAARLKNERDETEKTLVDIDLLREEQKKMVDEHISVLVSKEEFEAASDLQQAWEADQARFDRERAARHGEQPSPSANSVSAISSSGPASATSAPVVPKAAHVAPGPPAPPLQNGHAASPGVLESTEHLAHQGNDVIPHNIRLEQVQFMCSGQLQNISVPGR